MSLPVLVAFAGVLVAAVATGLLAARCVREPRACFIVWTAAAFGLTVALAAEAMGLVSGFGPVTFRAVQLGAQLAAPLWLAWGLIEFVTTSESARFGARLVSGALTVVGGLILATDSLSAQPFSKAWPSASVHYQSVSHYALIVVQIVALASGGSAVAMAAMRGRERPEWRAELPGVVAVGLALLATVALRFSLPVRSVYPLLSTVAAGLIWVGVTGDLEAVIGLGPRSIGGQVDGSRMGSRGRRDRGRHGGAAGDNAAGRGRAADGGGAGSGRAVGRRRETSRRDAGRYGPRDDEYGYDPGHGPDRGYGPEAYGAEAYVPDPYGSEAYGRDGYASGYGPGDYGSGAHGADGYGADGYRADGYGADGYRADGYRADGYRADGYRAGRRQGGYEPPSPYGPRERYGPDDRAGRGPGPIRPGEWVGPGGVPGFSGQPALAGPPVSVGPPASAGLGPGAPLGPAGPLGSPGSLGPSGPLGSLGPAGPVPSAGPVSSQGPQVISYGTPAAQQVPVDLTTAAAGTRGDAEFGSDAKPAGSSAGASARPYGRILIFTLLDDKAADFDRLAEQTAEEVRTGEPDTLVYVIHLVPNAPMQRIFYEIYRDRAAFDSHENKSYMKRFVAERRAYVLATNVIELRVKYAKVAPLPAEARPLSVPHTARPELPPGQGTVAPRFATAPSASRPGGPWPQPYAGGHPGAAVAPGESGPRYGRG